jgi:3-oxoacyl-[acyl-carrier protein] reductase
MQKEIELQSSPQSQPTEAAKARANGKLAGRIALITGAGRGLGGAIALDMAKAGADIVICDVDMPALEDTRKAVEAAGAACLALRCDISSSKEVADMFAIAVERCGTVHILVNNAALGPTSKEDEVRRNKHVAYVTTPLPRQSLGFTSSLTDEQWHRYWDVNVHGLFYCTREALKLMEAQQYGRIVNLASIAGFSPFSAHSPHYCATKGAVIAFTKAVAAEVAGGNIFVNALAPGGVSTPFFEQYLDSIGDEGRRRFFQVVPAGRFGTMQEYASMATYLAGDHYFVGQVISPNGGAVI